jgi:hypothetical protein
MTSAATYLPLSPSTATTTKPEPSKRDHAKLEEAANNHKFVCWLDEALVILLGDDVLNKGNPFEPKPILERYSEQAVSRPVLGPATYASLDSPSTGFSSSIKLKSLLPL